VPLRAIVFDFDGVLANTEPLHFLAYRDVLADVGVVLSEDEYYARYLGYDDAGAFRAIGADRSRVVDASEVEDLVIRKAARLRQLERESAVLFPGAAEAVRRLAAVFPLAIASGALRAEIERVLDATRLAPCFVGIVAAEDTPLSKPAPDPYLRAVTLLGAATPGAVLRAAECLAIEDSRWGLESARTAGLRTLAVTHTYPAEALRAAAEHVIDTLDVLMPDYVIQTFG
jgi:HAD superfamily hydrolase (TIGR01509 family)